MSPALRLLLSLIAGAIGAVLGLAAGGGLATGTTYLLSGARAHWPAFAPPAIAAIAILAAAVLAWRAGRSVMLALDKAVQPRKTDG